MSDLELIMESVIKVEVEIKEELPDDDDDDDVGFREEFSFHDIEKSKESTLEKQCNTHEELGETTVSAHLIKEEKNELKEENEDHLDLSPVCFDSEEEGNPKTIHVDAASISAGSDCDGAEAKRSRATGVPPKTRIACSLCPKTFLHKHSLVTHFRTHTGEKPFACPRCPKRFHHPASHARHLETHTGAKPFRCAPCGRCFALKTNLARHLLTHSGERPFECDACGKGFPNKHVLARHARTHSGERPYACAACGKRFADSANRAKHALTHTRERPHECGVCRKSFARRSTLVDHVKTHTGEKPFACDSCRRSFSLKSTLVTHARKCGRKQSENEGGEPGLKGKGT